MMRFLLIVWLALVGLPAHGDERAIRSVIEQQLDAFQSDDFDHAFTFASPSIRRIFETPERFGQMVRGGYPMVHRPEATRFGDLLRQNDRIVQEVYLTDGAGRLWLARYYMIDGDAGWKINGVDIREVDLGV